MPVFGSLALRPKLILAFTRMALMAGVCGTVGLAFVDRIGTTVSVFSEVTSPLLMESNALLGNAVRMRSIVFRGVTEGKDPAQVSQRLSQLDAANDLHIQRLGALAARANIGIRPETIEQNKRDYVRTLGAMIHYTVRDQELSAITKERLADFDLKHNALRTFLTGLANRAEGKLSASEDQAKVRVQTGSATVDELGELLANVLTETYPVLQNNNKLLQQVEQLDEMAKLIMAQAKPDDLAAIEQEVNGTFKTIDSILAKLAGRLRDAEGRADVAGIRERVPDLKANFIGADGLLAGRRQALEADIEIASSRGNIAAIERAYSGVLSETEQWSADSMGMPGSAPNTALRRPA
jgi:hypothetical protein